MNIFSRFHAIILFVGCLLSIQSVRAQSIHVQPGWNLLSLPVSVSNATKKSLFLQLLQTLTYITMAIWQKIHWRLAAAFGLNMIHPKRYNWPRHYNLFGYTICSNGLEYYRFVDDAGRRKYDLE